MIHNVHQRFFPGRRADEVGTLLDDIGSDDDRIWTKTGNFPPMRLDGPLVDLPAGRHGLVRYHTVDHQPGCSVTWQFDDGVGIVGTHRFEVVDSPLGAGLRHTIEGQSTGVMRALWPTVVRWLHDACLEELLDQAEASLTGTAPRARQHSGWVRLLLWAGPSPRKEEAWLSQAA